jgi:hypothetical protein
VCRQAAFDGNFATVMQSKRIISSMRSKTSMNPNQPTQTPGKPGGAVPNALHGEAGRESESRLPADNPVPVTETGTARAARQDERNASPADQVHHGGNAAVAGAGGGTDAAAGASLAGSKHGGPGGAGARETADAQGVTGAPGGAVEGDRVSPGAGAAAAGGTGLGEAASADDTRTGTGTSSGSGTALTGGGASGARDAANTGGTGGR